MTPHPNPDSSREPLFTPQLRLNPASRGGAWALDGLRAFFRRPLHFCLQFLTLALLLLTLSSLNGVLPYLGTSLAIACLPWASLAFMLGAAASLQGRFSVAQTFIQPWRQGPVQRRNLVVLGVAYGLASVLIMVFCDWADDGKLLALQQAWAQAAQDKADVQVLLPFLADPQLQRGLLLRGVLASLLAVPFWHAPALTHWCQQSALKSLFFSTVACWRNKGAFALYGAVWVLVGLGVALVANVVSWAGAPLLGGLFISAASVTLPSAWYASGFFTFAGCFQAQERPAPATEPQQPEQPEQG